jgi:small-conductance mechanosensitive channel
MEPAGLAVGVFAIAGLFNNAVDCFEFVQLGRNFETDFTTCILKLDDTKLQLSRWGQAVGLSGDLRNTERLNRIFGVEKTANLVAERLRHILRLFTDAENISHEFQSDKRSNRNTLQSCDGLDPAIRSLRDKLRNLSVGRQNITPLKRKAKWALYEEKHFRELVDDIKSTVDRLTDLFSSADSIQELCDQEAAEIVTHETRQVLGSIVAEQDKLLEAAIDRMMDHEVSVPGILCLH